MATNTALLDQIIEQVITARGGASTEDIADAALAADVFDDDWRASAEQERARYEVRKRVKEATDSGGMPRYFHAGPSEPDGPPTYKTIPMFNIDDYKVAAQPYLRMIDRAIKVLHHLEDKAVVAGTQLQLPFWLPTPVSP